MTTIAYDGISIAADTRGTSSFIEQCEFMKIHDCEPYYIALAGVWSAIPLWLDWFSDGHDPSKFPEMTFYDKEGDISGAFVVRKNDGALQFWGSAYGYPASDWSHAPNALGSGQEFAMGAMLHGATAREAVEIACKLDAGSGGSVQEIRFGKKLKAI